MDEDLLFESPADAPPPCVGTRDPYGLRDDLNLIKHQLAQLPTRNEVWRAAMLGIIGGAVAAVTLIEGFARSGL
jgi:hypothetical protein